MDALQWLVALGVAAGLFGFLVTLVSLHSAAGTRRAQDLKPMVTMAISQVLREEREYQAAARRIDDIERRHVVMANGDEYLALRSLAAQTAFESATTMSASFEDISARFQRMCEVGFHSPLSELAKRIEFAYACLEYGYREEGLRVLTQARTRLKDVAVDSQSRLFALIEWCGQLLESRDENCPSSNLLSPSPLDR